MRSSRQCLVVRRRWDSQKLQAYLVHTSLKPRNQHQHQHLHQQHELLLVQGKASMVLSPSLHHRHCVLVVPQESSSSSSLVDLANAIISQSNGSFCAEFMSCCSNRCTLLHHRNVQMLHLSVYTLFSPLQKQQFVPPDLFVYCQCLIKQSCSRRAKHNPLLEKSKSPPQPLCIHAC